MTAYKVLNVIMSSMINNFEIFEIINEKKEPTFFARLIMSIITGLLLFIF
jgi:Na+-transporting NADH:ubiquinone oxidoreductase subunit NqrB